MKYSLYLATVVAVLTSSILCDVVAVTSTTALTSSMNDLASTLEFEEAKTTSSVIFHFTQQQTEISQSTMPATHTTVNSVVNSSANIVLLTSDASYNDIAGWKRLTFDTSSPNSLAMTSTPTFVTVPGTLQVTASELAGTDLHFTAASEMDSTIVTLAGSTFETWTESSVRATVDNVQASSITVSAKDTTTSSAVLPTTGVSDFSAVAPTSSADVTPVSTAATTMTTALPAGKPTTAKPVATTTPDPKLIVKCRNQFPPPVANGRFEIVVASSFSVLWYTCNPGFRQVSGSALVRCGAAVGWQPRDGRTTTTLLLCEPVRFHRPALPPPSVPEWLVPMVIVAGVLLVTLILFTVLLFLLSKVPLFPVRVYPWHSHRIHPDLQLPARKTDNRRGWPWKRPWRPSRPQGQLGPDGVAMAITDDIEIVRRSEQE